MLQQHLCKNCGNSFAGNFCNTCGQKETHRITLQHVAHDLAHVFLHADKGIFPFMSRVVWYPGQVAKEYVDGKRKIFNPYQYLILSVGVVVFLMSKTHFYESMGSVNSERAARLPVYFREAMAGFNWFVKQYANIITFLALPIYALYSWFFFRKRIHNYAEHVTVLVFSMAQTNTFNALVLLACVIFNVTGLGTVYLTILLILISFTVTYKQFYGLSWRKAIGKGLIIYVCSYATQLILMGLGLVIYMLILRSKYP